MCESNTGVSCSTLNDGSSRLQTRSTFSYWLLRSQCDVRTDLAPLRPVRHRVLRDPSRYRLGFGTLPCRQYCNQSSQTICSSESVMCSIRSQTTMQHWLLSPLTRGVFPTAPTKPSTARVVKPRARAFVRIAESMVVVRDRAFRRTHGWFMSTQQSTSSLAPRALCNQIPNSVILGLSIEEKTVYDSWLADTFTQTNGTRTPIELNAGTQPEH